MTLGILKYRATLTGTRTLGNPLTCLPRHGGTGMQELSWN